MRPHAGRRIRAAAPRGAHLSLCDPLRALHSASPAWATLAFACANATIFTLSITLGEAWVHALARPADSPPPEPVSRVECGLAAASVALNTAITLAGWLLWRGGWAAALDGCVLLLAMDLAMYGLHRIAHQSWLYPWLHARHHAYTRPRPLTLFVMHPLECLGFGLLWLALIAVYSLPARWARATPLRLLGSSRFHLRHHQNPAVNLGFYTRLWNRLFGTLADEGAVRHGCGVG